MILFILTICFSIIAAEYQEGAVNLSQLNNDGIAFLGHWMFAYNPGNGTYIDFNQHPDKFRAGHVEITMKLSNPSILSNEMRIASHSVIFNSWQDFDIMKESMCRSYDWYREPLMNRVSDDTLTYTVKVYQHMVSRWWWIYLVNCHFKYNADYINNTDIHYKLHWKQGNDDIEDMMEGEQDINSLNQEISSNEYKQPLFSIITFVFSLLFLLMFCCSWYVFQRNKVITSSNAIGLHLKTTDSQTIDEGQMDDVDIETLNEMRSVIKKQLLDRMIMIIFSLILMFYVLRDLLMMTFWLNLSFNGYKKFIFYLLAMIFQSVVTMLFLWLFSVLFSVQKSKRFMIVTCILSVSISIFELIFNIYWYNNYVLSKEDSLYRYDYDGYFALYGWIMLCFGVAFAILYGYNGYSRCNKEAIIAGILILLWFSWPSFMLFVDFCDPLNNFEDITWWNYGQDFVTDAVSWTLRFVSIIVFLVSVHPLNPYKLNVNTKII